MAAEASFQGVIPLRRGRSSFLGGLVAWLRRERVDPYERIRVYARMGLIDAVPSPKQLAKAEWINGSVGAGPLERLRFFVRRPLDLFPTRAKRNALRQSSQDIQRNGFAPVSDEDATHGSAELPRLDRFLRWLFLFSPIRLLVQWAYNPFHMSPGSGLDVPQGYIISHLLLAPHPSALWDVQIIAADHGGLDALELELDRCVAGSSLRARVFRAMSQRDGYYAYLREIIQQVRRREYPPPPPGYVAHLENLVDYLNFAAGLELEPPKRRGVLLKEPRSVLAAALISLRG